MTLSPLTGWGTLLQQADTPASQTPRGDPAMALVPGALDLSFIL